MRSGRHQRRRVARLVCGLAALVSIVAAAPARAETQIGCSTSTGGFVAKVRPNACFLDWDPSGSGYGLPLAEAIYLRRIRWSSWGSSTATARAVFRTKLDDPYTRVKVRAYGIVRCEAGARVYTRIRVAFPGGHHTRRTPGC